MNVAEGLKLYEDFYSDTEVSKLFALVNDLRSAGKRGQFQGKFMFYIFVVKLQSKISSVP